jgi:UDP-N-acetylmuramate--alanine ligase
MNHLKNISTIYFIGIGGIGMSALARYFHAKGCHVSGYDRTSTPLTQALEATGIDIHYEERIEAIPEQPDVVVYTPAIPATHKELVYARQHQFNVVKRSDVLQWITENSFNICVAGTHGKTTVSAMIAHILTDAGFGCNAFLGGIAANYDTNFLSNERNICVVEADEYDRSFLKLSPDIAIITSMDADHLDIYETPEEVEKAFVQFAGQIKSSGLVLFKHGLARSKDISLFNSSSYSLSNADASIHASEVKVLNNSYHYNVKHSNGQLNGIVLNMGGLHNVENSLVAIAVAKYLGIADEKIKAALQNFKGVKRRFEKILPVGNSEGPVLIDDYAHHPEELNALISGVRSLYGDEKCTVIFQPHLYSRTKDQADGFARSLDQADEVILLPIYPARELPMAGVSSELIAKKMTNKNVHLLQKDSVLDWIGTHKPSLVVMCGAGDIDALVVQVKKAMI